MKRIFILTTALATGMLLASEGFAQQGNQQAQGSQQGAASQAQGGLPGQRLAQEQAAQQGTELWISPAGVRQVKQALNQQGYDPGNVNGQWNQEAQTAARNFQQAQGLEPTGQLNIATLVALGLNDVLQGRVGQQGQAGQAQGGLPGQQLGQEQAAQGGTMLYISPAAIRQIEQALNQAGYDAGNVDGAWDQQTQTAARNFQQANGLEPTGNLDVALINGLDLQGIFSGRGVQSVQGGQAQGGLPGQRLGQEQAAQGGTPLHVSSANVRQIKQALNQAGYDPGNVEAQWDQSTQTAVRNYQQAQGLEPTGNLTLATIAALGLVEEVMGQGEGVAQGGGQGGAVQPGTAGATGAAGATGGGGTLGGGAGQPGAGQGGTGQQILQEQ